MCKQKVLLYSMSLCGAISVQPEVGGGGVSWPGPEGSPGRSETVETFASLL